MRDNPKSQIMLVYVAPSCSASYLPETNTMPTPSCLKEIREHIVFFLQLFRRLHASNSPESSTSSNGRPLQQFLFGLDGPFYRLLANSPQDLSRSSGGLGHNSTLRIASLLYICAALLDHGAPSSERFLDQVYSTFIRNGLDLDPNLRLFFFLLIRNDSGRRLESAPRAWLVVRLMQVFKCLSWNTSLSAARTLLNFLMMDKSAKPEGAFDVSQDAATINLEVFSCLSFDR